MPLYLPGLELFDATFHSGSSLSHQPSIFKMVGLDLCTIMMDYCGIM